MSVDEIIRRENNTFELDELKFVVQEYIYEKKGRRVTIGFDYQPFTLIPMLYAAQVNKLGDAFETAREYFLNK